MENLDLERFYTPAEGDTNGPGYLILKNLGGVLDALKKAGLVEEGCTPGKVLTSLGATRSKLNDILPNDQVPDSFRTLAPDMLQVVEGADSVARKTIFELLGLPYGYELDDEEGGNEVVVWMDELHDRSGRVGEFWDKLIDLPPNVGAVLLVNLLKQRAIQLRTKRDKGIQADGLNTTAEQLEILEGITTIEGFWYHKCHFNEKTGPLITETERVIIGDQGENLEGLSPPELEKIFVHLFSDGHIETTLVKLISVLDTMSIEQARNRIVSLRDVVQYITTTIQNASHLKTYTEPRIRLIEKYREELNRLFAKIEGAAA